MVPSLDKTNQAIAFLKYAIALKKIILKFAFQF